ncbi:MAG TPA: hypothetical protein VIH00_03105 [Candidatus Limnocylindrales bacterium]
MHSYSVIVVNDRIESLLAEAADFRLAKLARKPGIRTRLASIAASVKVALTAPADVVSSVPALYGYPFES